LIWEFVGVFVGGAVVGVVSGWVVRMYAQLRSPGFRRWLEKELWKHR